MSVRVCPDCGEIDDEGRALLCPACREPMVDTASVDNPAQLDEDDQVVYELGEWTIEQRTQVAETMAHHGIPHAWDGDELIIHVDHEAAVDRLLEPIEGAGGGQGMALDPDAALTEYDMADWSTDARATLVASLVQAGVPHGWEGTTLLVQTDDEDVVDEMLDDLELGGDEASLADDGAETPFEVLESLFLAATRLKDHPLDADGLSSLAAAMDGADRERPPYGVDMAVWARALASGDELSDAITAEGEPDLDAAQAAATTMHRLLRDVV